MTLEVYPSIWETIKADLVSRRLKPDTITNMKTAMNLLFKITDISSFNDFGKPELAKQFLAGLETMQIKDQTKREYLVRISSYVSYLIKRQKNEQVDYKIHNENNPFEYLLKTVYFEDDLTHYPARTQAEIELWIGLIPRNDYKTVYALAASGTRRFEIFLLKKNQFDLQKREIKNIKRKGRKSQKRIGIPKWLIPILNIRLQMLKEDEQIISCGQETICSAFAIKHYNNIIKMAHKLNKDPALRNRYSGELETLDLIIENGIITLHSLRTSWITLASGSMIDLYRKFHTNHALGGQDDTYAQIYASDKKFKEYLEDMDKNSPQYDFKEI